MVNSAYIEKLRLCPLRPKGPLPRVSPRLVELIRDHGVIEPVVVRAVGSGWFEILSNVETWMAAQQVRLESVPIHVLTDVSDEEATDIVRAAFEGYAIDPIDEAEFLLHQLEQIEPNGGRYRAVTKLAFLTGHKRPYISHALRLLKLPASIQVMVQSGALSAGHARALVGIKNRSTQLALAKRVGAQKLSVRQVESLVRGLKGGSVSQVATAEAGSDVVKDPDTRRLETRITEVLGCGVNIDVKAGDLTIRYHELNILEGVLEKLGVTDS